MFVTPELDPKLVLSELSELNGIYPDYDAWFTNRVIPGIASRERTLLSVVEDGRLLAVAVLKKAEDERKFCSLWKAGAARGNAELDRLLLKQARGWLGTDRPAFSIPQDLMPRLHWFASALSSDAELVASPYRTDVRELLFNGARI